MPAGLLARWLIPPTQGALAMIAAHPIKLLGLTTLLAGGLALGLNAGTGPDPQAVGAKPPATDPIPAIPDDARLALLEGRLRDLERKLAAVDGVGKAKGPAGVSPATRWNVRAPMQDVLITRILVKPGEAVRKGDPLVEVRSVDFAQAKVDLRVKYARWDHDRKYLLSRAPLAKEGRITQVVWADTQNDEKKSRVDYLCARDKLAIYGMAGDAIDKFLGNLGDDALPEVGPPRAVVSDLPTLTIVSPADGVVVEIGAEVGNFFGTRDLLVGIDAEKP